MDQIQNSESNFVSNDGCKCECNCKYSENYMFLTPKKTKLPNIGACLHLASCDLNGTTCRFNEAIIAKRLDTEVEFKNADLVRERLSFDSLAFDDEQNPQLISHNEMCEQLDLLGAMAKAETEFEAHMNEKFGKTNSESIHEQMLRTRKRDLELSPNRKYWYDYKPEVFSLMSWLIIFLAIYLFL